MRFGREELLTKSSRGRECEPQAPRESAGCHRSPWGPRHSDTIWSPYHRLRKGDVEKLRGSRRQRPGQKGLRIMTRRLEMGAGECFSEYLVLEFFAEKQLTHFIGELVGNCRGKNVLHHRRASVVCELLELPCKAAGCPGMLQIPFLGHLLHTRVQFSLFQPRTIDLFTTLC